ncbi:MaoC family dehydratase N-terminal domain-containing protein [Dactylosporangium vinaceum]|uniref:MaoC family dehydratase N-terminal domain-containing protein n=1 Tax=Dactylosporangium vinaceum TaxID=53362 RepID=A0ABV5MRM4_9ACTN|nr:MaoC family dehydratase N-terminal domain-containing protein [Dactylosporangium vinaceum]UAC00401.1 MaoC family dehydratase N-terminal domain-containing protein [Dactylosporangium vinaceum]
MVDDSAAGITGEPFTLDVERGKIREFARATHSANPDYLEAPRPVIPPTFLTTAFFWQLGKADPWIDVAMDQHKGLHAEQEYVFHGPPPRAGDRLTGLSRIESVTRKEGRSGPLTFAVMVTEFRDDTGRLVATSRLTGVETA